MRRNSNELFRFCALKILMMGFQKQKQRNNTLIVHENDHHREDESRGGLP